MELLNTQICYIASDITYKGQRAKFGRTFNIRNRMKQVNLDCLYTVQMYKDGTLCTAKETETIVGRILKNFIDSPSKETFNCKKLKTILKCLRKSYTYDGIKYSFKILKF
jgi:hypothetical protein